MEGRNNFFDVEQGKHNGSTTSSFVSQIVEVFEQRDSKRILGLITYNLLIIYYLCNWVTSTNSIALSAYTNTICFNVSALLVCLVSTWVERNGQTNRQFKDGQFSIGKILGFSKYRRKFESGSRTSLEQFGRENFEKNEPCDEKKHVEKDKGTKHFHRNSELSLGLEKYEVLALLVFSSLSLIAGVFVFAELIVRLSDQPKVHTGRLGLGALLGFLAHLGTIIGYPDAGLNHVVCRALPCPTLRGCNPILGGNMISGLILSGTHLLIDFWEVHSTDTAAAFAILALTATSMLPLAFYTFNVLLQKLPLHMSQQLDRCLREALIIDGVLEFRNERFWTRSFGKLAGNIQVRLRRNANGTRVLETVMLRLSKIVTTLTIQEFRESRNNYIPGDPPIEYYVDEILSSCQENIDIESRSNFQTASRDIEPDIGVIRIEDIIGMKNSRIETFPLKSGERKISYEPLGEKRTNINVDRRMAMKTLTIFENDNICTKNLLWQDDANKNALLYGTKFHIDKFQYFFSS